MEFKNNQIIKSTKWDFLKIIKYYPESKINGRNTFLYVTDDSPFAAQHFEWLSDQEFIELNGVIETQTKLF